MQATDVKPDRLSAARDAARALVHSLPEEFRLGVVSFNTRAEQLSEPTTDRTQALRALESLKIQGATAMGDGLRLGVNAIRTPVTGPDGRPERLPGAIVLLSDGANTSGNDPLEAARAARAAGVPVSTVALGTPDGQLTLPDGRVQQVPPDPESLREIAEVSGGRAYAAADAGALEEVYKDLGSQIGTRPEQREITAGVAGAGVLLLLAALGTGLRRRGSLP
jgi:Ca-activated chloride channel homolog